MLADSGPGNARAHAAVDSTVTIVVYFVTTYARANFIVPTSVRIARTCAVAGSVTTLAVRATELPFAVINIFAVNKRIAIVIEPIGTAVWVSRLVVGQGCWCFGVWAADVLTRTVGCTIAVRGIDAGAACASDAIRVSAREKPIHCFAVAIAQCKNTTFAMAVIERYVATAIKRHTWVREAIAKVQRTRVAVIAYIDGRILLEREWDMSAFVLFGANIRGTPNAVVALRVRHAGTLDDIDYAFWDRRHARPGRAGLRGLSVRGNARIQDTYVDALGNTLGRVIDLGAGFFTTASRKRLAASRCKMNCVHARLSHQKIAAGAYAIDHVVAIVQAFRYDAVACVVRVSLRRDRNFDRPSVLSTDSETVFWVDIVACFLSRNTLTVLIEDLISKSRYHRAFVGVRINVDCDLRPSIARRFSAASAEGETHAQPTQDPQSQIFRSFLRIHDPARPSVRWPSVRWLKSKSP